MREVLLYEVDSGQVDQYRGHVFVPGTQLLFGQRELARQNGIGVGVFILPPQVPGKHAKERQQIIAAASKRLR
ncbi:MAG: hypothetical protein V4631_10780 [Pseudomonadota bacterium]